MRIVIVSTCLIQINFFSMLLDSSLIEELCPSYFSLIPPNGVFNSAPIMLTTSMVLLQYVLL